MTEVIQRGETISLRAKNKIAIKGQPIIYLHQSGLNTAYLWTDRDFKTKALDRHYVCVEHCEADPKSGYFGSATSLLSPGEVRGNSLLLSTSPEAALLEHLIG